MANTVLHMANGVRLFEEVFEESPSEISEGGGGRKLGAGGALALSEPANGHSTAPSFAVAITEVSSQPELHKPPRGPC